MIGVNYRRTTYIDTPPPTTVIDSTSRKINGAGFISNFTPLTPIFSGVLRNPIDGKFYFMAMGMADTNRDQFIFKYNASTNIVEQMFRVSIGFIDNLDTHRTGVLDIDSDGNIYFVFEELHIAPDSHGGPIHVWKTSSPCDLLTFKEINKISGRWSYPVIKVNGNNIFISARGSTNAVTFVNTEYWYFNSSDGGITFDAGVKLYDSDTADQIAYLWTMPDMSDANGVAIILNERDNSSFTWSFISLIRGQIGSHVWTNYQGTFSKNASSSGFITRTEFRTNCMVVDGVALHDTNFDGGYIKADGSVRLLVSFQEQTGNEYLGNRENELLELRFYYYSSGWQHNDIDIPAAMTYYWAYQRSVAMMILNETFDDVIFIDRTDLNNVYRKRSSDNFTTQTDTLVLSGNSNWRFGGVPLNTSDALDEMMVLVDTQVDEFNAGDVTDYSDLLIVKL